MKYTTFFCIIIILNLIICGFTAANAPGMPGDTGFLRAFRRPKGCIPVGQSSTTELKKTSAHKGVASLTVLARPIKRGGASVEPKARTLTEGLQIYSNSNNHIEIKLGEEFAIELDSKSDGGYKWQLAKALDQKMLNMVGSEYRPNEPNNKDLKGKEVFLFRAVGRGETMISLKYARYGERDMYPIDSKIFIVFIK